MVQFARHIVEKWNIQDSLAREICISFEKGFSPYFLADYHPPAAAELDAGILHEIFDFLREQAELAPKKKRLINALSKANKLAPDAENHINALINPYELDDMLVPYRLNPRSRAQLAIQAGIGPLADVVEKQDESVAGPLEDLAKAYAGKAPAYKTVDDVITAVRDILIERFSSNETARTMARDHGYEEASFEIIGKKKSRSLGDFVNAHEIKGEKLLELFFAEDRKQLRLKLNIQLFRVTELIKHHFITNPDSVFFDFLSSLIDECWLKVLLPMVERDVKQRLRTESEDLLLRGMLFDLDKKFSGEKITGTVFSLGIFEADTIAAVAFDAEGHLVGATSLKNCFKDRQGCQARFRQFAARYRPSKALTLHDAASPASKPVLAEFLNDAQTGIEMIEAVIDEKIESLAASEWIKSKFSDLDPGMQKAFAAGISWLQPVNLIPDIGLSFIAVHPLQDLITPERMLTIIRRKTAELELRKGIGIGRITESVFVSEGMIIPEITDALRKRDPQTPLNSKQSLLNVPHMTEAAFANIAGFVVVPNSQDLLDRTLVHPDHTEWVAEMCDQMGVTAEQLIADPEMLRSFACDDYLKKLYIEKKLIDQIRVGQKYLSQSAMLPRRKQKLADIVEGAVASGRVTNITPFGVFVDINAVCDGLIHISQLADGYVQSPEQVVQVGDKVNVRIIKVDPKKRRISLSMKGMGHLAPKVKPTKTQLSDLANHFKNR